ncbi:hypothetical protein ABKV19_002240 [Rosa sericea]
MENGYGNGSAFVKPGLKHRLNKEEEEEMSSRSSVSSFTSSTGYLVQEIKCVSHGSSCAKTKSKGVVLQQNGHWGSQLCGNHNPVWLGTFNSEVESSMAYDGTAMKLRNGECQRSRQCATSRTGRV